jgi:hypothetical protein
MGPDWDEAAIVGLYELMRELTLLSSAVQVTHKGNIFESGQAILLGEFNSWVATGNQAEPTPT